MRRPRVWLSRCPSTYRRSGTYRKLQPLPGAGSAPLLPTARLAAVLDPNQHLVFWVAVQPQESQAMPSVANPVPKHLDRPVQPVPHAASVTLPVRGRPLSLRGHVVQDLPKQRCVPGQLSCPIHPVDQIGGPVR